MHLVPLNTLKVCINPSSCCQARKSVASAHDIVCVPVMFRSNSTQKTQSTMASPPFLRSSSSTSSLPSSSSSSSSTSIRKVSSTTKEGTAKATVNDHISQAVQSTSNLLQLMQQSSPSQAHLLKLPKNLLAKTATIKNTAQVLEQMPRVISALDAHMESGLHSAPHLKTVTQLLSTMESTQLQHSFRVHQPQEQVAGEADKVPEPRS